MTENNGCLTQRYIYEISIPIKKSTILFPVLLICILRLINNAKYVHCFIANVNVGVTEGRRTRRSTDNSFHPQSYDLDIQVDGSIVQLHLIRNDELHTSVPTLSLDRGDLTEQVHGDTEVSFVNCKTVVEKNSEVNGVIQMMFLNYFILKSYFYFLAFYFIFSAINIKFCACIAVCHPII